MIQILFIYADFAVFILRIALGVILLTHGIPKLKDINGTAGWFDSIGFKPGKLWATVAGYAEVVGGAMLIAGFFTQLAALILAAQFATILTWRLKTKQKLVGGYELDLIMFAALLLVAAIGSSFYALDSFFGIFLL